LRLENSPKGIAGKEDLAVKGSTVNAKDIHLTAGNNIRILSSESKSTTIEDPKVKKRVVDRADTMQSEIKEGSIIVD